MSYYLLMQGLQNSLVLSGIYILTAIGISLILGAVHIVNFAHGSILMISGYVVYSLTVSAGINYAGSAVIAVIVAALAGIIIQKYLYGRFFPKVLPVMLVAVGLSEGLQQAAVLIWGGVPRGIPSVISGSLSFAGSAMSKQRLMAVGISVVIIIALFLFVYKTKRGRALRAIAQDPDGARLMGVSVKNIAILCMAIGCGLAGAAGALVTPIFFASADMGVGYLMKAFAISIMGGLGSLPGTLLAGLIIGTIEGYGFMILGEWCNLLIFALVLLVLMVRPTGLIPGVVFEEEVGD